MLDFGNVLTVMFAYHFSMLSENHNCYHPPSNQCFGL